MSSKSVESVKGEKVQDRPRRRAPASPCPTCSHSIQSANVCRSSRWPGRWPGRCRALRHLPRPHPLPCPSSQHQNTECSSSSWPIRSAPRNFYLDSWLSAQLYPAHNVSLLPLGHEPLASVWTICGVPALATCCRGLAWPRGYVYTGCRLLSEYVCAWGPWVPAACDVKE